jgi:hypothetical protein
VGIFVEGKMLFRNFDAFGFCKSFASRALLISHLLALSVVTAEGSPIQDQGQIFSTDGIVELGIDFFSQSITAGVTGNLTAIEIQCDGRAEAGCTADVRYSIYSGGNPVSGSLLYTELVTENLEASEVFSWLLPASSALFFEAGEQFTFAFQAQQTGNVFAGNDPPGYDGGELFKNGVLSGPSRDENGALTGESRDVAFITYVTPSPAPIPIPSSMALLGSAFAGMSLAAGIRRRRRQ